MDSEALKAIQAPLKALYREAPTRAQQTLVASGRLLTDRPAITLDHGLTDITAGLHPAVGGDGSDACSAEILLAALASCAGVTLTAVATAMAIPLRGGRVTAEGDLDFRGTLGVAKEVAVGFTAIRLRFHVDTDASDAELDTLIRLSERYCVVFQTLRVPPTLTLERERGA